jgi:signal transduction histidine kinase
LGLQPETLSETARLRTLNEHALLDTLPEEAFDGVVRLTAESLHAPLAFFSLMDGNRIWFKARYGSDAEEIDLSGSFCGLAASTDQMLIVEDAAADSRFSKNPIVTGAPFIRFYAGLPLHAGNGAVLGALCVMDTTPRIMTSDEQGVLKSFAREIEARLDLRRALLDQQQLNDERAILTHMILHDAGGIIASLRWNLSLLEKQNEKNPGVLGHCREATDELMRLCSSVSKINDNSRRQLEIAASSQNIQRWFELLGRRAARLVSEAGITLVVENKLPLESVVTDVHLIERIITNLVRNATDACSAGASIYLEAQCTRAGDLEFTVSDDGPGVPEEFEDRIFEPYFTYHADGKPGTGLGLAFASLAAIALGGTIKYNRRDPSGAEFVLTVPVEESR